MNKKEKPIKKTEKKVKKEDKPESKPGEIPVFKSPSKTAWGKIIILIIVAAMILIPLITLIVLAFQ